MNNKKRSFFERTSKMGKILKKVAPNCVLGVFLGYTNVILVMFIYMVGVVGIVRIVNPNVVKVGLVPISITIGIAVVLKAVTTYFLQMVSHKNSYKTIGILRNVFYKKLRELCPSKIETKEKIESINLVTSDINALEFIFSKIICPGFVAILCEISVFIFITFYANIHLAIVTLFFFLVLGVLFPYLEAKLLQNEYKGRASYLKNANTYFDDTFKGINDVSADNILDVRYRYASVKNEQLFYKDRKIYVKENGLEAGYSLIICLSIMMIIYTGYISAKYFNLSPNKVMIVILTMICSLSAAIRLKRVPLESMKVKESTNRLLDLLEEKPLVDIIDKANNFDFESLEARGITFDYEGRRILKNVELVVNKGEIVGIYSAKEFVGESTILKLFLRFYDIADGNILYNNIDIKRINTKSLMDNVSLVSDSTYIFNDTMLNNIKIANPQATLEEVRDACKLAHIDKFILSLEKGYDTEIKMIHDELTSATKERIGLARAYLSKAPLILLDNVCSNADSIGQGLILRSIVDMSKDRTFLMLSKKKDSLKIASRVYRIKEGEILEEEYNVLKDEEY